VSRDRRVRLAVAVLASVATLACGAGERDEDAFERAPADEVTDLLTALDSFPGGLGSLLDSVTGDIPEIRERRLLRFLTVSDPMFYGVDQRRQGGLVYEGARRLEEHVNEKLGLRRAAERVRVILIPVRRDQLIPLLAAGRAEIAAANLTVTEERAARVAFSEPFFADAKEILVSSPGTEAPAGEEGLSGRSVYVRASSSYRESLEALNGRLDARGLPPVRIVAVDEILEDGDILQLVERGDIPLTVVDSHIAEFWRQLFPEIVLHSEIALREGGEIAWALRADAPGLRDLVDGFVREHKVGTLLGNVLVGRYMESPAWVRSVRDFYDRETFTKLEAIFRQAEERHGFDWRLLAAQAIQESGLDPNRRSAAGAVGLMQLMPATARQMGFTGDLTDPAGNVDAAARYMEHVLAEYFPGLRERDSTQAHLMALAAYNAGPTRLARLRATAESRGFDPDRWSGNVELIVAREVGQEPVNYVANIVKSYVAFRLGAEQLAERRRAIEETGGR
jgi:membrane-bound lytic murein transglycosylase MltF